MGWSALVIADATSVANLGTTEQGFRGLAGIFNQDNANDAIVLNSPTEPSLAQLHAQGAWLGPLGNPQVQVQEIGIGTDPSTIWVGCTPFVHAVPGNTIAPEEDVYPPSPGNEVHGYVAASFVIPAVGNAVSIEVLSACNVNASAFAAQIGDYVDRSTNKGLFLGGLFWDLVSIDDSTHITIRNTGKPGAAITAIG